MVVVCGNYNCTHGAASFCYAKGRAVLCKQTEGEICRPLVAVCGIYNCTPGAASLLLYQGARGAMQANRGGDMQAISSCLWYIQLHAWRRISPAIPKGRAVLCMQTEGRSAGHE